MIYDIPEGDPPRPTKFPGTRWLQYLGGGRPRAQSTQSTEQWPGASSLRSRGIPPGGEGSRWISECRHQADVKGGF